MACSPSGRYLATADPLAPVLVWDLHATRSPATAIDADRLWADLCGDDAPLADAARRRLLTAPELAVNLVRERLQPPSQPDPIQVKNLIKDLDHPRYDVRQKAGSALEKLNGSVDPSLLREALATTDATQVRRELQRLLHRSEQPQRERIIASRCHELLEQLGTPAARELLRHHASP